MYLVYQTAHRARPAWSAHGQRHAQGQLGALAAFPRTLPDLHTVSRRSSQLGEGPVEKRLRADALPSRPLKKGLAARHGAGEPRCSAPARSPTTYPGAWTPPPAPPIAWQRESNSSLIESGLGTRGSPTGYQPSPPKQGPCGHADILRPGAPWYAARLSCQIGGAATLGTAGSALRTWPPCGLMRKCREVGDLPTPPRGTESDRDVGPEDGPARGDKQRNGRDRDRISGIAFDRPFPGLRGTCGQAHRRTLVQFPRLAEGNLKPLVSRDSFGPTRAGSLQRVRPGPTTPRPRDCPLTSCFLPRSVEPDDSSGHPHAWAIQRDRSALVQPYAPFDPSQGEGINEGLKLRFPRERLDDRRRPSRPPRFLLEGYSRPRGMSRVSTGSATRLTASLKGEWRRRGGDSGRPPPRLSLRHRHPWCGPDAISKRGRIYDNYVKKNNAKSLRQAAAHGPTPLRTRLQLRSCDNELPSGTVPSDVNNERSPTGMRCMAPPLDHALSIEQGRSLRQRLAGSNPAGSLGEMGRAPPARPPRGPGPLGGLGPLLLVGGGYSPGQVIGRC